MAKQAPQQKLSANHLVIYREDLMRRRATLLTVMSLIKQKVLS